MKAIGDFFNYFGEGFNYIFTRWDRVADYFFGHLQISVISLLVAILIAFPLGFLISRQRWLGTPVLGFLNILYTIPSLAFLALLVPIFGLTATTTIVVLIAYSQTMLVRNIAIGFNSVAPAIIEAARGMGMSGWQVIRKVELPLALPVILAGMRITSLAIISIATIGAWAGAQTLGRLMQEDNPRRNAAGIILVVLIALAADLIYRLIGLATGRYRRQVKVKRATVPTETPVTVPSP